MRPFAVIPSIRAFVFTAALIAMFGGAVARAQTMRIGGLATVAESIGDRALSEPHLAVDPSDPKHLLAAAIVGGGTSGTFDEQHERQSCAAFLSLDGGVTWARHDFATTWCFDPWVVITPDGQALITMVAAHASLSQQGRSGLVVFHSADGGRTWDDKPIGLGANHDHPTMAIDLSSGPRRGWIYLFAHRPTRADEGRLRYGVYTARSRNGGRSFDDPVYVIVNNLHNLPEMPAVLADGTLFESFVDCCHTSDSGAVSASTNVDAVKFERRRAWVVRSTDGGHSFSTPLFITDACGPPPAYQLSAFAADASPGPFAGRLYFACRKQGNGPIVVTTSRDRGETWSPAVEMRPETKDSIAGTPKPAIAANAHGVLAVAWIEAGGQAPQHCVKNVYFAASLDGGKTFSAGRVVSRSAGCDSGGDYFGVVATPDGAFRLLWSEPRDGVVQLRTTTVQVGGVVREPD